MSRLDVLTVGELLDGFSIHSMERMAPDSFAGKRSTVICEANAKKRGSNKGKVLQTWTPLAAERTLTLQIRSMRMRWYRGHQVCE